MATTRKNKKTRTLSSLPISPFFALSHSLTPRMEYTLLSVFVMKKPRAEPLLI
ncbi:hypothetical protein RchiOBHm_Chr2g0127131 [Rosa chinensis]|uniref:Uncharacterized protein n=1 Tax=Rosa chinensis TaxID=74649 RepID=A0A2P6RTZ8_ROSCH|nr:hypothetical protein RchiOBHm_Chr2g0127131 [Rosa chinensis]